MQLVLTASHAAKPNWKKIKRRKVLDEAAVNHAQGSSPAATMFEQAKLRDKKFAGKEVFHKMLAICVYH